MFLRYVTLAVILLLPSTISSQNGKKVDSLLQIYNGLPDDTTKINITNKLFKYYRGFNNHDFKGYAEHQYELSKKLDYQIGIGYSWGNLGRYYDWEGKKDSVKYYYNKSLNHFKEIGFPEGEAKIRLALSWNIIYNDEYLVALEHLQNNTAYFKKVNDTASLYRLIYDEAFLHQRNRNYQLALEKSLTALTFFEKKKDTNMIRAISTNLSYIEGSLKHYDKAIEYSYKAFDYIDKTNKQHVAGNHNTLATNYVNLKDFKKSDSLFNIAFELAGEMDWPQMQMRILMNQSASYARRDDHENALKKAEDFLTLEKKVSGDKISSRGLQGKGSALLDLNKVEEAKVYLDRALTIALKENNKRRLISLYSIRSEASAKLNNYRQDYEDYKMGSMIQDSIYDKTNLEQIENLRIQYDTQKKEQQIAQQESEISILEEQEKVSKLQKLFLGFGLALSLIALGFGFYGFRQKIKRKQLEKEKIEYELNFKTKELTTHALHLAKKNETLNDLKEKAKVLKADANADPGYQMLIQTINFDLQDDNNWDNFSKYFEQVHKGFNNKAQELFPKITKNDLRLMALLKMNLSSKEIANILNISSDGIKKARQRLRKKMGLDSNESLEATVISI